MAKTAQILIRLAPAEREELQKVCRRHERSVAGQLRLLIREFLAQQFVEGRQDQ